MPRNPISPEEEKVFSSPEQMLESRNVFTNLNTKRAVHREPKIHSILPKDESVLSPAGADL